MKPPARWFAITVIPADESLSNDAFEGLCVELVARGAAGTAVDQAPEITCFLEGDTLAAQHFIERLPELGCELLSSNELAQENWSALCPDLWEPIEVGKLCVVPVESIDDPRPTPPQAIKIIPGLGFGTGHHATTRMILKELDTLLCDTPAKTYSVLDIGTGSGILAIAAAQLLGVPVEAIDIDPLAIQNAQDNVTLNNVEKLVNLSIRTLSEVSGTYDLILANVYGEVLMNLAQQITDRSKPGALAILSGITEIVWDQVSSAYTSLGWSIHSEQSEGDWLCARLEWHG